MKITIELDPSKDQSDVEALKGLIAAFSRDKKSNPISDLLGAEQDKEPEFIPKRHVEREYPSAQPLRDSGRQVTEAAEHLGKVVGERRKMSTKERAKVAAEARWGKDRVKKKSADAPGTKRIHPKAIIRAPLDHQFDGAEEQSLGMFREIHDPIEFDHVRGQNGTAIPDGRDILDGSFENPNKHVAGADIDIRDIYERARAYE